MTMILKKKTVFTSILLSLFFLGSVATLAAPRGNLMIFYSSDVAGEIEPCG